MGGRDTVGPSRCHFAMADDKGVRPRADRTVGRRRGLVAAGTRRILPAATRRKSSPDVVGLWSSGRRGGGVNEEKGQRRRKQLKGREETW